MKVPYFKDSEMKKFIDAAKLLKKMGYDSLILNKKKAGTVLGFTLHKNKDN